MPSGTRVLLVEKRIGYLRPLKPSGRLGYLRPLRPGKKNGGEGKSQD